jgi:glutathione peroxidase
LKKNIYDFEVEEIDGKKVSLSRFKGRVLLVVNVASDCGFTSQYEGLQKLYENYKDQGLSLLAFPSNDFAGQEPEPNAVIKNFCQQKYKVSFDLFSKVSVVGPSKSPLFDFLNNFDLIHQGGGGLKSTVFEVVKWILYSIKGKTIPSVNEVQWNFHKYLIGRDGIPIASFLSEVEPDSVILTQKLEEELQR